MEIAARTLVVLLTLAATPALAEPQPLTMDEAIATALSRSPTLAAARFSAEAADARADQADSAWLPRVNLEAGYTFSGPVPELSIDTGFTAPGAAAPLVINRSVGTEHHANATVKVGWRAYDFGARDLAGEAAEVAARAARSEGEGRAVDVSYAVRASYLAARLFLEVEETTSRALELAEADRKDQQALLDAGLANAVGVASVDSRIAQLEARRTGARQSRQRALATLRVLLGLPEGASLTLADALVPTEAPAPTPEGDSPTLERLDHLALAAELHHDALGRGYWPTLDVFGQVAYQYPQTLFDTDEAGVTYAVGVALSWPLFDGDLRSRQRDEALARVHELRETRRAAEEQMTQQVVEARAQLETAAASALAAERSRETAHVYLTAARGARRAGTGTELEVRKAEEALDGAQLSAVQARFDAAMARAALLRAQGSTGLSEVAP